MQKLPEASDRNRDNVCAKKRDCLDKRKELTFSTVTGGVTTSKFPLLLVEGHVAAPKHHVS